MNDKMLIKNPIVILLIMVGGCTFIYGGLEWMWLDTRRIERGMVLFFYGLILCSIKLIDLFEKP